MRNLLLYLIFASLQFSSFSYAESGESNDLSILKEGFAKIDKEIMKGWASFERKQKDENWIKKRIDSGKPGIIHSKGFIGAKVSRQIIPNHKDEGFYAIDTITLGKKIIPKIIELGINIFATQLFFISPQIGKNSEKKYTNTRYFNTYEDALKAPHFKLSKIPYENDHFEYLMKGEQISTITDDRYYFRLGQGIFNLLGIIIPAVNFEVGPMAKFSTQKKLKFTITKSIDDKILLSIEKIQGTQSGFGIGLGLFFEDIIDFPITIGIGQESGYSPFMVNKKKSTQSTNALIFEIDLRYEQARKAFASFHQGDFTLLEDYSKLENTGVKMDLIKDGVKETTEYNASLNLIFWKSGQRKIYSLGDYVTTTSSGDKFKYSEVNNEKVKDLKNGKEDSKTIRKYSALIPMGKEQEQSQQQGQNDKDSKYNSFLLDTLFYFSSTRVDGSRILTFNKELRQMGRELTLPIAVFEDEEYDNVHINIRSRLTHNAISKLFSASDEEIWIALAQASTIFNSHNWKDSQSRDKYKKSIPEGDDGHHLRVLKNSDKVRDWIDHMKGEENLKARAKLMVDYLQKGEKGRLLHRTIFELAGHKNVHIKGYIKGENFLWHNPL